MKSMAKAILVGGLIVAAQAAMADGSTFPRSGDDSDHVTVQSTYADRHANDPVRRTGSTFPASGDDSDHVTVQSTYADRHANDPVRPTGATFPVSGDDSDHVTVQSTYADSHLGRPALASWPMQGADTSAE